MVREISSGGVVVRRMRDSWWIAAIQPQPSPAQKKGGRSNIWALPKGLVDDGENPEQAALREVREETGIEATVLSKLDDIRYTYVRSWGDRQRVFKVVSFFLLRYRSGRLGNIVPEMRREVRTAQWIPLDEAHQRISYGGERQMVKLAQKYILAHPEI